VQTFAAESLHIPQEKQKEMLEKQKQSGAGASSIVSTFLGGLGGMLTNFLLVLIYLFLFVHYRRHFVDFLLKLVPAQRRNETREVVGNAQEAIQKYFTGMAFMIICLWVMYGIGFSIIGVKNPIFFAMLCGTLEIVPFVGNLAGTAITMLMAIGQGGSMNMIIWIVVVYAVVQFIQSYILEPLVVGKEVKVNPFFTIAGIVAGEVIWGIPGMIMALPTMAIFKIVCDHVESLHPYGFLIGNEEEEKKTKRRRA
jgi:predicted PurR-regulated permease PerM